MTAIGFAPGKVILLGEHSVVFGRPALAASLSFGITMHAEPATSGGLRLTGEGMPKDHRIQDAAALIAGKVGVEHAVVRIESALTPAGGLGSSAAFAVALIRALSSLSGRQLPVERLAEIALDSEQIFHGRPSGVDHSAIAHGGIIRFWKGPPPRVEPVLPKRPLTIVVGLTGKMRSTGQHVLSLAQRVAESPAHYEPLIDRLGELTIGGCADVEQGDLPALGARMSEAHELLSRCGVSAPTLDAIVQAARGAGALGAKLTGAGGGGAAVALTADDPEPVVRAIRAAGFEAHAAILGVTP